PVPVLAPGLGKTKTGRLWTYVRDDRPAGDSTPAAVWFAYSPDRKGEHPQSHLSNFTGTLQADGYAGFDQIYEAGHIQEAACWAHVRRKFYDLEVAHKSPVATEALQRIAALYAIEKEIRGRPPDERREVRNTRSDCDERTQVTKAPFRCTVINGRSDCAPSPRHGARRTASHAPDHAGSGRSSLSA